MLTCSCFVHGPCDWLMVSKAMSMAPSGQQTPSCPNSMLATFALSSSLDKGQASVERQWNVRHRTGVGPQRMIERSQARTSPSRQDVASEPLTTERTWPSARIIVTLKLSDGLHYNADSPLRSCCQTMERAIYRRMSTRGQQYQS